MLGPYHVRELHALVITELNRRVIGDLYAVDFEEDVPFPEHLRRRCQGVDLVDEAPAPVRIHPVELFHVLVLHVLPSEANRTAAAELAICCVLVQEVAHYLVRDDVADIVGVRHFGEGHARNEAPLQVREGGATTVPRVDRCVDLDPEQLVGLVGVARHSDSGDNPFGDTQRLPANRVTCHKDSVLQFRDINKVEVLKRLFPESIFSDGKQSEVASSAFTGNLRLPLFRVPRPSDIHGCGVAHHMGVGDNPAMFARDNKGRTCTGALGAHLPRLCVIRIALHDENFQDASECRVFHVISASNHVNVASSGQPVPQDFPAVTFVECWSTVR
mmetsp:Transcript_42586/g.101115  ORF Transcript_42586/g.101115 Transcript_42586/m.101115 type:complete len:330 (-) Transcript_42586:457-1446(-)